MKKKREENGKSYLADFVYKILLGISVLNLKIGRLFSTSWEVGGHSPHYAFIEHMKWKLP
jgi:hypothetical protein